MKHNKHHRRYINNQSFQHFTHRLNRLETRDAAAVAPLPTYSATGVFDNLKLGLPDEPTVSDSRVFMPHRSPQQSFFISGVPARIESTQIRNSLSGFSRLLSFFPGSRRVVVCIRRQARRRVLFALQKIKKGSHSSFARPKWSSSSRIICRSY